MAEATRRRHRAVPATCRGTVLLAALLLAACATAPPLDTADAQLDLGPHQVVDAGLADGTVVLWGGMIIDVVNHADRTEIELLAYPLDHRQRPRLEQPSQGRFIAVMPGFADPLRYPQGRFLTLRGRYAGPRDAMASAPADLPRMRVQSEYLWPRGFRQDGPQFRIGIGVTL